MHSKAFFATILLSYAAKSLVFWGRRVGDGGPGQERAQPGVGHEALVRASGKDLAQGQGALIDPT